MEREILLEIKNLETLYTSDDGFGKQQVIHAVNGLDLTLHRQNTLGLVGETGAGKTTTALSIMRLLPERTSQIKNGEIIFEGRNLLDLNPVEMQAIRGEKISMIFQDPMTSLNPVLNVDKQIAEAIMLHNEEKLSKAQIEEKVDAMLNLVGIPPERKHEYPHQFSGGMKQRVVIAIALACNPRLIIADEPTTALDVTIQAQVLSTMQELKERLHTSMLLITHDLGIVAEMCDHVAVMYAGKIVESGTVEDIFTDAAFRHPYTEGLFSSIPNVDMPGFYLDRASGKKRTTRLQPIEGLMPDPAALPPGCAFSPRCPRCTEVCKTEPPVEICRGTHRVFCRKGIVNG
jgi:peptide/nickel transport system ATP-binding protein